MNFEENIDKYSEILESGNPVILSFEELVNVTQTLDYICMHIIQTHSQEYLDKLQFFADQTSNENVAYCAQSQLKSYHEAYDSNDRILWKLLKQVA